MVFGSCNNMFQELDHNADESSFEYCLNLSDGESQEASQCGLTEFIDHPPLPNNTDPYGIREWYQANDVNDSTDIRSLSATIQENLNPFNIYQGNNIFDFDIPQSSSPYRLERQLGEQHLNPEDPLEQTFVDFSSWSDCMGGKEHSPPKEPQLTRAMHPLTGLRTGPYAELVYQCLKEAPNYQMTLQDIYEWIATHTDKGNCPGMKGGVRHNLSLNEAFEKVNKVSKFSSNKGSMWRLKADAVVNGIKPSTHYRVRPGQRKNRKRSQPLGALKNNQTSYKTRSRKFHSPSPLSSSPLPTTLLFKSTPPAQVSSSSSSIWHSPSVDYSISSNPAFTLSPFCSTFQPTPVQHLYGYGESFLQGQENTIPQQQTFNVLTPTPSSAAKQETNYFATIDPLNNFQASQQSLLPHLPRTPQQARHARSQPHQFPTENQRQYGTHLPSPPYFSAHANSALTPSSSPQCYPKYNQERPASGLPEYRGYPKTDPIAYEGTIGNAVPDFWM